MNIELELKKLFNQLEDHFKTGVSLKFTTEGFSHFHRIDKVINLNINNQNLDSLKWDLAHEFGHASLAVFFNMMKDQKTGSIEQVGEDFVCTFKHNSKAIHEWMMNIFKKICVQVESEQELLRVYEEAKSKGIPCSLILDMAHTEFDKPTYTCVAIGPAADADLDFTKKLKLY